MNTRIIVQTDDEISRVKAIQKELKQLKELLINKDLDKLINDSYLEVAAFPRAKVLSFLIEDKIEDREWISTLVRITIAELPETEPKKKKAKKPSKK